MAHNGPSPPVYKWQDLPSTQYTNGSLRALDSPKVYKWPMIVLHHILCTMTYNGPSLPHTNSSWQDLTLQPMHKWLFKGPKFHTMYKWLLTGLTSQPMYKWLFMGPSSHPMYNSSWQEFLPIHYTNTLYGSSLLPDMQMLLEVTSLLSNIKFILMEPLSYTSMTLYGS